MCVPRGAVFCQPLPPALRDPCALHFLSACMSFTLSLYPFSFFLWAHVSRQAFYFHSSVCRVNVKLGFSLCFKILSGLLSTSGFTTHQCDIHRVTFCISQLVFVFPFGECFTLVSGCCLDFRGLLPGYLQQNLV
jgi:hypothetical protein